MEIMKGKKGADNDSGRFKKFIALILMFVLLILAGANMTKMVEADDDGYKCSCLSCAGCIYCCSGDQELVPLNDVVKPDGFSNLCGCTLCGGYLYCC